MNISQVSRVYSLGIRFIAFIASIASIAWMGFIGFSPINDSTTQLFNYISPVSVVNLTTKDISLSHNP